MSIQNFLELLNEKMLFLGVHYKEMCLLFLMLFGLIYKYSTHTHSQWTTTFSPASKDLFCHPSFFPSSTISSSSWFWSHLWSRRANWLTAVTACSAQRHRHTICWLPEHTFRLLYPVCVCASAHSPKVSWSPNRHRDGRIGSSTDIHRAVISVAVPPPQKRAMKGENRSKESESSEENRHLNWCRLNWILYPSLAPSVCKY